MHTFEAALRRFRAELSAALGLTLAACGPGVPAITTAAPMTDTDASTGSDVPTTSTSAGSTSPDGPGATSMATGGPSSDGVFTTSHASSTGAAPASSSDTGSSDTSSSDTSSSDTGSSDASSSDTGSSDASSSDTGSSEASTTGEGTCRPFTLPFEPEVGCFTPPDDVACAACDDFCVLLGIDTIVTEGLVGCGVNQLEYCVLEPPPPDAEGPCCYTFIATISCDGRPFLVAGVHRTAPVVTRDDWSLAARPDIGGLDPATRVALADAWTTDALAEHASIAAFARFVLHLLAVGAPPGLLRDAQQALADEIDHAARTFGLASAYAGRAVGPGPIDITDALPSASLAELATATFLEGCLGETLSALAARVTASVATDPAVRDALVRIADDESRHAALAWRFVQWALARDPTIAATLRVALRATADTAAPAPAWPPGIDHAHMRSHGRLAPDERARLDREGHRDLIRPCAEALLASVPLARRAHGRSDALACC